ncbi:MAG: DEAD/DEAH box helicase, partial [Myxococcales bacterium]|nr:DEAD/DEAH box helicase [Myxococcales bacterium]
MSMSVELSAMPEWLQSAFATRGFTQPTPIQTAVLDPELRGRDLRIASATGSGKTIALSAVLGETLFSSEPADREQSTERHAEGRPRVLIVAPTRELALQLAKELRTLYGPHGHRVALVLGGGSYRQECAALRAYPSVLVATPGRLVDHMQRGQVHLDAVAAVALDEADQLLALGFQEELDTILAACPDQRRTIMVSATFRGPVKA